jgi:choline dehydrogenase
VGENLQDHLEIYFQVRSKEPVTLYSQLNLISKGMIGAEWLLLKTGLGSTNHFESCGFIRSGAGVEYPDIQYHFLPAAMRYDGTAAFNDHGFQVHVGPMRSKSRGFVRIRSKDPHEAPRILFNYLSHPDDLPEWRRAVRLTREIFRQPAMQRYAAEEIQPGAAVEADAEIDAFIREHCESAYHPCGTCRMGAADDPMAVVDPQCRVIGIEGLRVADSSIMPLVTNGNLNAPSLMIGEKASDLILGKDPLPPSNQEPWINPEWRVSQR